ncbi:MAG: carbon-nitrogen hydrolase family protein [Cytophagales bacterium]|nr:carbon-nitrogen hydrolase family protein [Cytophagales bacterium]
MRIALAQTQPVTGNIEANVLAHVKLCERAVNNDANAIVFSELSLTGYEPALAKKLAVEIGDERLLPLQELSDKFSVIIAAGIPVKANNGVQISLLFFQPKQAIRIYAKQFLHPDEKKWFVSGKNLDPISIKGVKVGFAICYELAVQQHFESVESLNPNVYVASVAKFERGIEPAHIRLAGIARNGLPALMVNAIGPADDGICAGQSAVWNAAGKKLIELPADETGILMYDTVSMKAWKG